MINQDNSLTVQTFKTGDIDGAWVPEPYASQLVAEGGTKLVDEADLWPDGQFVTTQLIATTTFIDEHPDLVNDLLAAQIKAEQYIDDNSDDAKQLVGDFIADVTQTPIPADVLDSAWSELTFTNDPDRGLAHREQGQRGGRRPHRRRRPGRPVRPRPAQQVAHRRR